MVVEVEVVVDTVEVVVLEVVVADAVVVAAVEVAIDSATSAMVSPSR